MVPRLIIVAEDIQKQKKAQEYLIKKGWPTQCVRDLKTGLKLASTFNPTHLLLSLNVTYQNPQKLAALRDELKEKHNVTLVVFAETEDVLTVRSLTGSGIKYIIYPPVTGSLIHVKLCQMFLSGETDIKTTNNSTFVKSEIPFQAEMLNKTSANSLKKRVLTKHANPKIKISEIRSDTDPSSIEAEAEPTFRAHCENPDVAAFDSLETVEDVCVVSLKSNQFAGYLVLARGKHEPEVSYKLLQRFTENLIMKLQLKGINITEFHFLNAKVNRVKFDSWAKKSASFCFASVHQGAETAIAFIPTPIVLPVIEELPEFPDYVGIRLNDIKPNIKVNFEIYLYLEKNRRFFHLLKKGTFIEPIRIERIRNSKSSVYIASEEKTDFKNYHIQNNLNASIEELSEEMGQAAPVAA